MKDMLAVVLVLRAVYEVAHYRVETPWKLIEEWRKYVCKVRYILLDIFTKLLNNMTSFFSSSF